jgi:hypothetical protein
LSFAAPADRPENGENDDDDPALEPHPRRRRIVDC